MILENIKVAHVVSYSLNEDLFEILVRTIKLYKEEGGKLISFEFPQEISITEHKEFLEAEAFAERARLPKELDDPYLLLGRSFSIDF